MRPTVHKWNKLPAPVPATLASDQTPAPPAAPPPASANIGSRRDAVALIDVMTHTRHVTYG